MTVYEHEFTREETAALLEAEMPGGLAGLRRELPLEEKVAGAYHAGLGV